MRKKYQENLKYQPQYSSKQQKTENEYNEDFDYNISDDLLNNWMSNAREQASSLLKQTIEDLKGMIKIGTKEAAKSAGITLVTQIIIGLIILIAIDLIRLCNSSQNQQFENKTLVKQETSKIEDSAFVHIKECGEIDKEFQKFDMNSLGIIHISKAFELKSGIYKKIVDEFKRHFSVNAERVVFQQRGLNNMKNMDTYARIIIRKSVVEDVLPNLDTLKLIDSDISELNQMYKFEIYQMIRNSQFPAKI